MKKGLLHIYCGGGKGKTTAAIGLGVRAAGSGMRVFMTQFLKTNGSSELRCLQKIDGFKVADAPSVLPFYFAMSEKQKGQYKKYAGDLWHAATKMAQNSAVDLLIFDEILDAIALDIICLSDVLDFLSHKPNGIEVVFTGRQASDELIEQADYVSEINPIKHPFEQGIAARKGIEF